MTIVRVLGLATAIAVGAGAAHAAGSPLLRAKSPFVAEIRVVGAGSRPRFSPSGTQLVYDRETPDGRHEVVLARADGSGARSLTAGRAGLPQRSSGSATFDPSGRYVVFASEAPRHLFARGLVLSDPGFSLFANLWAVDVRGRSAWRLTTIPLKQRIGDGVPVYASVNPQFSPDGKTLVWTQRYAEGGKLGWGRWRLMSGRFEVRGGRPRLERQRVLYTPRRGNYVNAMGFFDRSRLLVAGNLDGQDEYGMDEYRLDLRSGRFENLTRTPALWEEGASVGPRGEVAYMSNATSTLPLDPSKPWETQPVERELWLLPPGGAQARRLTFFNDPSAPEYLGARTLVAASAFAPGGRTIAASIGLDRASGDVRGRVELKIALIALR